MMCGRLGVGRGPIVELRLPYFHWQAMCIAKHAGGEAVHPVTGKVVAASKRRGGTHVFDSTGCPAVFPPRPLVFSRPRRLSSTPHRSPHNTAFSRPGVGVTRLGGWERDVGLP